MDNILRMVLGMIIVSSFTTSIAFGHGLGSETHPPVTLEGRDVTMSVNISPSTFNPNDPERYITIKLNESKSQAVVEHVTYMLEMSKDGEQIFRRMFHDDLGNLAIKVINDGTNEIKIQGDKSPGLEAWMRTSTEPVTMTGPVFDSGGLYEYKVEIIAVDEDNNILDERLELVGAISLAESKTYDVKDSQQNTHQMTLISYFDRIQNFEFNSNLTSFSMPFDWSQDLEQISVVHQEIRIPPNFSEFLHTKYDVMVNGISLEGNDEAVTIDDYSSEGRTLHIVLNKNDLKQMREPAMKKSDSEMIFEIGPSKEVVLPLQAVTPDLRYRISLSWEPKTIVAGQEVVFLLKLDEMYAEKTEKEIEYAVRLTQNDIEIFQEQIQGTVNSEHPDEFKFVFPSENSGTVKFDIYDIEGNSLSKANFLAVVNPLQTAKFPIPLESKSESNPSEGNYRVDLTWFPSTLGLGESEFVMTFYDKNTGMIVKQVEYDFVLLKGGSEIHRESGFASAGGTFENFVFVENETGDLTLRIENIDGTDEYVQIHINVTPEFPFGVLIIFLLIMISIITLSKTRFVKLFNIHYK